MMHRTILFVLAVMFICICMIGLANAQGLGGMAQDCANDLARRNALDHKGFGLVRGRCVGGRCAMGATAENVSYGCRDQACAIAQWMRSPGHRANIMRGGASSIAWADSASGRRYWCQTFQ